MAARRKKVPDPLERARELIRAWPETSEKVSHGAPTWWGGKKTFACFRDNHHGDGRIALWIKADLDAQEDLIAADPELFFVPPYVGHKGWVGAIVAGEPADRVDWNLIASLLEAGYRSVAPKRALAALDD